MSTLEHSVVTIRAEFPCAQAVFIMGDFNNWSTASTPMIPVGFGQWEVKLRASPRVNAACFFVYEQGKHFGRLVRQHLDRGASELAGESQSAPSSLAAASP